MAVALAAAATATSLLQLLCVAPDTLPGAHPASVDAGQVGVAMKLRPGSCAALGLVDPACALVEHVCKAAKYPEPVRPAGLQPFMHIGVCGQNSAQE